MLRFIVGATVDAHSSFEPSSFFLCCPVSPFREVICYVFAGPIELVRWKMSMFLHSIFLLTNLQVRQTVTSREKRRRRELFLATETVNWEIGRRRRRNPWISFLGSLSRIRLGICDFLQGIFIFHEIKVNGKFKRCLINHQSLHKNDFSFSCRHTQCTVCST